jgi:hypothetical protein
MRIRSTWTRRVAAPVAAVAAVTALLAVGTSEAAASTITVHQARALAEKIVAQQRHKRSLVYAQLGDPVRKSSSKIVFPYRDRSTSNVLCTARIVAVATSSSRRADLKDSQCNGIAGDVLAFERATRSLVHSVRVDLGAKVRKSRRHYRSSLAVCDQVSVPRSRRGDVKLLVRAGGAWAFYSPLRSRLGTFSSQIDNVSTGDPNLVRGQKAWDRTLVLFDSLPAAASNPCRAVKKWADNGFSSDTAPADFGELKVELSQFADQSRALDQVAKYLDDAGVRRTPARAFAPNGLLALALQKH